MDVQAFWTVIGHYNEQTWMIQIVLLMLLISAVALSYMQKVRWSAKFLLGITNLFIGIGFFARYGTEPIQAYFALPLYLFVGTLFLLESRRSKGVPGRAVLGLHPGGGGRGPGPGDASGRRGAPGRAISL